MILVLIFLFSHPIQAEEMDLSMSQSIYVPAYSHIYTGSKERPLSLTVTLSIRNIDPNHPIEITTVDYFETQGQLIKHHLEKTITLNPLGSTRYVVAEKGKRGSSGANFIVNWKSSSLVNPPLLKLS